MCAATLAAASTVRVDETLDAVLSPSHDAWVEEVRRLLLPATMPDPVFWDRWSMVRYLNEGFLERFSIERAVLRELQPFITAREMNALEAGGERVAQLHLTLDRMSRRRPTSAGLAALTQEFLNELELWCAEVELACNGVSPHTLSDEARLAVKHLAIGKRLVDS